VTVKGAAGQLTDLAAAVSGVGPGTSLADKVALAQDYLQRGDVPDACTVLSGFINQLQAQSGNTVPAVQARALIVDGRRITTVLGCRG